LKHGLVQEALAKVGEKFASPQHVGPTHVADFEDLLILESEPKSSEMHLNMCKR